MVVLHYTAMASCEAAAERLCDPEFEVSAHYLIGEDGTILRLVAEDQRAWHAGAGRWGKTRDVNSHSIGIELANTGTTPFAAAQMDALEALLPAILGRWSISPERVIGHSDMAPDRKSDPGARFDWARLARQGLAIAPRPGFFWPRIRPPEASRRIQSPDHTALRRALTGIGYTDELPLETVLRAFRLRFRPSRSGPPDATDLALAQDIARRFPVDQARHNA
ncbi:N-acetylmuramoyl-L-alanine amidase [Flavimaricola marinus]|uniref:N-acetylmuramoyl-L-alanine amidase n=1 Tax=Flavimaricola marinus TaxID=1819565 RepID=A0A238LFW4_9RHOB|nr:N-acetylmuramoyl-L-alanine amidase [Flavimaricola marinus]SMY08569.1 N-acetylmuramoyl-L-alanine amidase AmiD precursor [Flavimaricola marinus]